MSAASERLLESLLRGYERADREITEAQKRRRDYAERIDDLRRQERPAFPTSEQVRLLEQAVVEIEAGTKPRSHHGDPVLGSSAVLVDGARGWLLVSHKAPFSKASRGSRLWAHTDEEVRDIIVILATLGYKVIEWWKNDIGTSFLVKAAS